MVPKRKLRRDFSEDFADDFPEDDDTPAGRRQRGVQLRFRWGLPKTKWSRMAAGAALVVLAGLCFGALLLVRDSVMHDPRFFIQSASSIEIQGNVHLTRDDLINIFGEDVERNIFYVSLAQRRAELQQLPWVEHATVMRLLPNRLRVSIVERTPVAFVRQGSQIGLVDASGVLLDMPQHGDAHYSFPVVTGIVVSDPLSTRTARMKIFEQFTSDLDSSGEKISEKLSEIDLSNPEDVKAVIPDGGKDVLVHFGDTDFLNRYRKFEEHLAEWRTQYPALSSVDMRYERQVVLEMQQGAAAGGSSVSIVPTAASTGDESTVAPAQAAAKPVAKVAVKPRAKAHVVAKRAPVSKWKRAAAKARAHRAAAKAHARVVHHAAGNSRYHSSQVVHP
ncbi:MULTISPECIES: cell division protein FtsQ/DivIB [Acidobacteriaceae]|uniref:cell division protein FtsQ/DivIB n=1 Tax=Acidobacteriaceae TaxID=204434 RepID=UPI00131BEAF0|nr:MULTISPECIES: FtsQ-type POTRA domain-containing protein [Acidobacteriaceae]MDW5264164.1 FtsQ-type POTRA domain-containing protein [Edaphobacter sp.]